MSSVLSQHVPHLEAMKKYPSTLFYKGNLDLLKRPKVSIVGTRRPSNYTRQYTFLYSQHNFVVRNELVVALGDILVVTEADLDSGSMCSVEYALKMGKEIFVLPQRLGESLGTNQLLNEKRANAIHDIEAFASRFGRGVNDEVEKDEFFYFCQNSPTFDESLEKYGDRVYEAELDGVITIQNGIVRLS